MIQKKPAPARDAGWSPASCLREAQALIRRLDWCFGGRRQVGQDRAPMASETDPGFARRKRERQRIAVVPVWL
jgi:hypothetical protein